MLNTSTQRLVRTSTPVGFRPLGGDSSYTSSMRVHRLPDGENVLGRVVVSVVPHAALRTRPGVYAEDNCGVDVAASRACLARRKPAVDLDHGLAVHFGFGLDGPDSGAHAGVADGAGEVVVLNHPAQVEVLYVDYVEPVDKIPGEFIDRILTARADLLMDTGELAPTDGAAMAALGFARQLSGEASNAACPPSAVLRVGYPLAGRERGQAVEAEVDTDGLASGGKLYRCDPDHEGHEILARCATYQPNRRWLRDRVSRPLDLERTYFGELELSVASVEGEAIMRVVDGLIAALTFEGGVGRPLGEEVGVRFIPVINDGAFCLEN